MTRAGVVGLLLAAVVSATSVGAARAESTIEYGADPDPLNEPDKVRIWYGWQILVSDIVSAGLVVGATEGGIQAVSDAATVAFLLGGPVIHVLHGRTMTGLYSLGLKVGLPLGGALIGFTIGDARCQREEDAAFLCGLGEIAVGVLVGYAVAEVIDVFVLARKERTVYRSLDETRWLPILRAERGGGTFGLLGRF